MTDIAARLRLEAEYVRNWHGLDTLPDLAAEAAALIEAQAAEVERLRDALLTSRDYVSDAAHGFLTYEGSGEGFIAMAKEDLERVDAAIASGVIEEKGSD